MFAIHKEKGLSLTIHVDVDKRQAPVKQPSQNSQHCPSNVKDDNCKHQTTFSERQMNAVK